MFIDSNQYIWNCCFVIWILLLALTETQLRIQILNLKAIRFQASFTKVSSNLHPNRQTRSFESFHHSLNTSFDIQTKFTNTNFLFLFLAFFVLWMYNYCCFCQLTWLLLYYIYILTEKAGNINIFGWLLIACKLSLWNLQWKFSSTHAQVARCSASAINWICY